MRVSPSVHILRHDFEVPVAPGKTLGRFVYSVLVFGESVTLVDSGVKGCHERILDYVAAQGRRADEIGCLILSHAHPDHIGSASRIKALTGCRVLAHKAERAWMEHVEAQNEERPVPGFFNLVDSSVTIDGFLEDGQTLDLKNGLSLKCFHTPGHSQGSVSLLVPEEGVLFTGDCIPVEMDIPNYDDFRDLENSLAFLKGFKNLEVMLSSWAEPVYDRMKMREAIEKGEDYLSKVDAAVKKHYLNGQADLNCCRGVITELGLPLVFVIPMVHKAFLSHVR
ncbi:MAG: MBL fold metallo-hydrolase [Candidatus Omnitrophota bacterium]|jgi:glyoxylase-like metal-dependent hydrolase (beta-lactamase superfamily II)